MPNYLKEFKYLKNGQNEISICIKIQKKKKKFNSEIIQKYAP